MKKDLLPIVILIMSLLYIFVIPENPKVLNVLFKLIPMMLMIAYAFLQLPQVKLISHKLIITGLIFCMLGDCLIAFSFVFGLAAFLIGHLFYMAGFFRLWNYSFGRLFSIVPIWIYSLLIGISVVTAVIQGENPTLMIPVIFYIIVISFMCWSAFMVGNRFAIIGSVLFVISDSILSWNMFVSDVAYSGIFIMVTYYSAQFLIAKSLSSLATNNAKKSNNVVLN